MLPPRNEPNTDCNEEDDKADTASLLTTKQRDREEQEESPNGNSPWPVRNLK